VTNDLQGKTFGQAVSLMRCWLADFAWAKHFSATNHYAYNVSIWLIQSFRQSKSFAFFVISRLCV